MSARETVLNDLRGALGSGVCPAPENTGVPGFGPDDWALLRERAELRGARYVAVGSLAEAAEALAGLLAEYGASTAMAWDHPDLDALGLADVLERCKVKLVPSGAPLDDRAKADIGITAAAAVLPEAGSVIVTAGPGMARQVSLLPPVHVALAVAGRSVPVIEDLPGLVRSLADDRGMPPSAMHVITGPSSTADIEKTVIKGVHGPTACVILAVEH